MMNHVNLNGQQLKFEEAAILPSNRSFSYGDGVFETIRCLNSQPLFFDKHYQRLRNALYHLKIELSPEFTENYFRLQIQNLLQRNRIYKGARARLSVFRNEGGLYTPSNNTAGFVIIVEPLGTEKFELNAVGYHIDIFRELLKPVNFLSQFKTSSALLFIMAGLWKKEQKLDDCFILNQSESIIESLASNIFLVKGGKLITPSVESGCVDGTMRRTILEIAVKNNIAFIETDGLNENHLLSAEEVFITNAVAGIHWVSAYKDKRFFHTTSSKLVKLLNDEADKQMILFKA